MPLTDELLLEIGFSVSRSDHHDNRLYFFLHRVDLDYPILLMKDGDGEYSMPSPFEFSIAIRVGTMAQLLWTLASWSAQKRLK